MAKNTGIGYRVGPDGIAWPDKDGTAVIYRSTEQRARHQRTLSYEEQGN